MGVGALLPIASFCFAIRTYSSPSYSILNLFAPKIAEQLGVVVDDIKNMDVREGSIIVEFDVSLAERAVVDCVMLLIKREITTTDNFECVYMNYL